MLFLTEDAVLVCNHENGLVDVAPGQDFVTIEGRRVLIDDDPEKRSIKGCSNFNPLAGIRPCLLTLSVRAGYSGFVRVAGKRVCLDTVTGLTDGTPPGIIPYKVRAPGQAFVSAAS
jgi:hypothetical protein